MTSKERAALRSRANQLDAIIQIGKGGISENLINQVDSTLNVRDLIKIRVLLESAPQSSKELAIALSQATQSEVIQVIGGIIVLYREVIEKPKKVKAKAKVRPNSNKFKGAKKGKVVRGLRQRNEDKESYFAKKSDSYKDRNTKNK